MQVSPFARQIKTVFQTLRDHLLLVVLPAVLLPALAAAYATFRPPTWKASQALLVREEAGTTERGHGRFENADAMKTAQETILEIARHRKVIAAALKEVGPPRAADGVSMIPGVWPSNAAIEALAKELTVSAPKGSEFGRTEVIYLSVKARERDRAIALASALCDHLDARLKEVRNQAALGVITELEKKRALCKAALDVSIQTLEGMERAVGSDLGELRILNEQASGDSNLRTTSNQIKNELRQARASHEAREKQREFLAAALEDANRIVATPNELLLAQPALRRLKDGLVDAQLRTAQLQGTMSNSHPRVRAAKIAEDEVRRDLHNELRIALRGVQADMRVSKSLVESLEVQAQDVDRRLNTLAGLRARYSNLVADVKNKTEILDKVAKDLASERARQSAASTTSLLTQLESPAAGNRPSGPGKTTITLAGLGGGLLASAGILFLLTPMSDGQLRGRRFTDQLWSRRSDDRTGAGEGGASRRQSARDVERRSDPPGDKPPRSAEQVTTPALPPVLEPPAPKPPTALAVAEPPAAEAAVTETPLAERPPAEAAVTETPLAKPAVSKTAVSEAAPPINLPDYHKGGPERREGDRRGDVDRRFGDDRRNTRLERENNGGEQQE